MSTPEPPPPPDRFAPTRWTLVAAAKGDTDEARAALSELCAGYYAPVVRFLRSEGRNEDQARDLAHGFFAKILEGGKMHAADPARGRFRSYLLGALKHFLQHERRSRHAGSRGAHIEHLPLQSPTHTHAGHDVADPCDPMLDRAFDRQWALTVLDRALAAIGKEMGRLGKQSHFEAMRPWLSGDVPGTSQSDLATQLGLSIGALKVALHRLRQRFRHQVMAEISQTVGGGEAEAREELNYLIQVIASNDR